MRSGIFQRFSDNDIPYDPIQHADLDITLSSEQRDAGGLGIFMAMKTMDQAYDRRTGGFQVLAIEKSVSRAITFQTVARFDLR